MLLAGQGVGCERGQSERNKLEYHAGQEEELRKGRKEKVGA